MLGSVRLDNGTFGALLLLGHERGPCGVLKDLPDSLARLCTALEVLYSANLLADVRGLSCSSTGVARHEAVLVRSP